MSQNSEIKIQVVLDEKKTPKQMFWEAQGPEGDEKREVKAMLLSLFDKETLDTFKIDLWTTELQIAEMDRMMYYSLKALADTYFKATKNHELSNQMQQFVEHFGKSTKILAE